MDIESFLRDDLEGLWDAGRRGRESEHRLCWGMVGGMWVLQARIEGWSLECFDCSISLWLKFDRQD